MADFTARPASLGDIYTLFKWRNDPVTRANSISKDWVYWNDHVKWVKRQLKNNPPTLFIFYKSEEPVGTFRIDGDNVSYTVSPDHRGEGIATRMLKEVHKLHGCLVAEIFEDNEPSLKAARNAGLIVKILERQS